MKGALVILLCGVLLSGCVSAPPTEPSQIPLKSENLGLGKDNAPLISDQWWKAFGDPQLDRLVEEALRGSPTLAAALARMRLAQSQLSSTRAGTYPQIELNAQETRERFSENYIVPPPYGGSTQWVGSFQSDLSWSLDLFGKQQAQVDKARAGANAAALDATAARLVLAGSVTQAYISLSRAYALCDVAEEAVKQRSGFLNLVQGRVKGGLDSMASQRQAEVLQATAEQDLLRANAVRDMAVHQIAALIGRGADAYDIARPKLNPAALALPATLPADLLARRADVAAALARVEAATAGRQAAHQAFYPDINLIGLAGWTALGLGPMFSSSALQYGAGGALHLPIFDAGKIRADYAGATAELDRAIADYNETLVTAVKQTADALTALRALDMGARAQAIANRAAKASYEMATERYRVGIDPETRALDAQTLLIQVERSNAGLIADEASARVALLMAIGGGFDATNAESAENTPTGAKHD